MGLRVISGIWTVRCDHRDGDAKCPASRELGLVTSEPEAAIAAQGQGWRQIVSGKRSIWVCPVHARTEETY